MEAFAVKALEQLRIGIYGDAEALSRHGVCPDQLDRRRSTGRWTAGRLGKETVG